VPKKGRGHPKYEPTPADRATVQNLAALGAAHKEIAMCIGREGVSEPTLRKHFRRELDKSLTEVKALAMSQVVAAMKRGEAWAVCFFLKGRAGWKEKQGLEHSGPGNEPLHIKVTGIHPTDENT
jgi:hypothetical protein